MGTVEEPNIREYAEGNGNFTRQNSEFFLLDTLVFLFEEGNTVKVLSEKRKLHYKLRIAITRLTEGFENSDPSWSDVAAITTSEHEVGSDEHKALISEYFREFVLEFLNATHTNRKPNLDLVRRNREVLVEQRRAEDFNRASIDITKLMHWSSSAVLFRQEVPELEKDAEPPAPIPVFPKPSPQPYGVSHYGAEVLARDWMRHIGHVDAQETQKSSDGGIDVYTAEVVVQVKNYKDYVGVPAVRELLGVAVSEGKRPVLFTSGSLTTEAADFAARNSIPTFKYSAELGTLDCLNGSAKQFLEESLQRLVDAQQGPDEAQEPFEVVLAPFQVAGEIIKTFMNSFYSMKSLFSYRNTHEDLFDTDADLAAELIVQMKEVEAEMQKLQDVLVKEMAFFSEHMSEGDSSPDILASAQRARGVSTDLANLLDKGIDIFLRMYASLGAPSEPV